MKNRLFCLLSLTFVSLSLSGCGCTDTYKDISIIYTTDVHSGVDDKLGYSSLYAYKEKLSLTNNVTLIDSGDFLQGDYVSTISSGKYVIDVMNEVGYDIVTLGNHEFDYGMDILSTRLSELNADVTSCNFTYTGHKENKFSDIKPYIIKDYGFKKIGYVGVTTPTALVTSDPKNFIEDNEVVYDFHAPTAESFYEYVQDNINSCKKAGADYVILLSHLGSLDNYSPYSSIDVLTHTSGVFAFLDGHAHVSLPWKTYKNKDNIDTLLVDTGYKLNNFASLTIKKDGDVSFEFIDKYDDKSSIIDEYINNIKAEADEKGNKVLANIDIDLKITDEDGIRIVRNRETPIGNMVADAYKAISDADIGVANGGGIRANLSKGDVTYKDIQSVHPFGNVLMKKKVSGQMILDYLEFASMKTQSEYKKDGRPLGESGCFASVSSLKYTIDTSIPTSVVTDASGEFIKVDGPRRVKNVQVLENNTYVDIDINKEYIIASHNFLLENGGDGANMFKNAPVVPDAQIFDYEVVIKYIVDVLKGHLKDNYETTQGRINII